MSSCGICLQPTTSGDHHPACLQLLFGTSRVPALDIDLARLHTAGLAMIGKASLSGVQRKVSLGLTTDRMTLQVALPGGRYILKPQSDAFPALPENEHVCMRIGAALGIDAPPCGLVRLHDGTPAYVVARFDRPEGGGKHMQEDFCQLAEKYSKQKYEGSAELCARLVRTYATDPGIELLALFQQWVLAWWIGNGDAHLKNFSLLATPDGAHRLAPAYDCLSTRLVIQGDPLALPLGGRKDRLRRHHFLEFAAYCGIGRRAAERVLDRVSEVLPEAVRLAEASWLPDAQRRTLVGLLKKRAVTLRPKKVEPSADDAAH